MFPFDDVIIFWTRCVTNTYTGALYHYFTKSSAHMPLAVVEPKAMGDFSRLIFLNGEKSREISKFFVVILWLEYV